MQQLMTFKTSDLMELNNSIYGAEKATRKGNKTNRSSSNFTSKILEFKQINFYSRQNHQKIYSFVMISERIKFGKSTYIVITSIFPINFCWKKM